MTGISRRQFLILSANAAVGAMALPLIEPLSAHLLGNWGSPEDFRMAVLGDSVLWGMGLREENKIHNRIAHWLEADVFQGKRKVAPPVVVAHVGAKMYPLFDKKERPLPPSGYSEIGAGNPSVFTQVELAAESFRQQGVALDQVELIIVNGGANDLRIHNLLIILVPNGRIRSRAKKYCHEAMSAVLSRAAITFPNARIVVPGYYPLISKETVAVELPKSLFGLVGLRKLGAAINIPFYRDHIIRDWLAARSRYWQQQSDIGLRAAVAEVNAERAIAGSPAPRAIFVPAPFKPANSYAAPDTYLWQLVGWGHSNDDSRLDREAQCKAANKHGLDDSFCKKGAFGHPNVKGAAAYAEAIELSLMPLVDPFGWRKHGGPSRSS